MLFKTTYTFPILNNIDLKHVHGVKRYLKYNYKTSTVE